MVETWKPYEDEVAPAVGFGVGHGGVGSHGAAPAVLLDETQQRQSGLFFRIRRGVAQRGLQIGEKQRRAALNRGDGFDYRGFDGVLREREREREKYGGDEIDVSGNERRRDVGDREVADAQHLQVVEGVGGEMREVEKGQVEEAADLNYTAGILLVFDDLEMREKGKGMSTFTTELPISSSCD